MKLFIIGNGFDINLGLPTKFTDFAAFLDRDPTEVTVSAELRQAADFQSEVNKELFQNLQGLHALQGGQSNPADYSEWNKLEDSLHTMDEEFILSQAAFGFERLEGEAYFTTDLWSYASEYLEDLINPIIHELPTQLEQWISNIEIFDVCEHRLERYETFGERHLEDLFLTFNYTLVLQNICKLRKIHHLHGSLGSRALILGHAAKFERRKVKFGDVNEAEILYPTFEGYSELFRKRHEENMNPAIEFLEKNTEGQQVNEILVCGHSVGLADKKYFTMISNLCPTAKWTFTPHSQSDKENVRRLVDDPHFNAASVKCTKLEHVLEYF